MLEGSSQSRLGKVQKFCPKNGLGPRENSYIKMMGANVGNLKKKNLRRSNSNGGHCTFSTLTILSPLRYANHLHQLYRGIFLGIRV